METRVVIAYILIAFMLVGAIVLAQMALHRRREHRRLMRGHGRHKYKTPKARRT